MRYFAIVVAVIILAGSTANATTYTITVGAPVPAGTAVHVIYPATGVAYPGAVATYSYGENALGEIVGMFNGFNGTGDQGFLYNAGVFRTIDVPGSTATGAYAINNYGQIAGVYNDSYGVQYGFFYDGSSFFYPIDYPGAGSTEIYGLNDLGQMVGDFFTTGAAHGFVDTGGIFDRIDVPGALFTEVDSINDLGQIEGIFSNSAGEQFYFFAVPTPLPSAWTMMLIGLVGLGFVAYPKTRYRSESHAEVIV